MKYTITIYQPSIIDAGFGGGITDIVDWAIIDYIGECYVSTKSIKRNLNVLVDYRHFVAQMPIVGLKRKSEFYRRIKKLTDLGLLESESDDNGNVYASMSMTAFEIKTGLKKGSRSCTYCGATDVILEMDHIIPKSKGGDNSPENLTPACRPCNASKGSLSLAEWRAQK